MEKNTTTAFAYLRVSGKGQINGDGFDRQLDEINAYCERHNITLTKIFREEAISGTKDETERPAFQTMVSEIFQNGTHTIIIEGMDRLARELRIQEALLVYLASKNITLVSARTDENVTQSVLEDPMKKALVQMQGVFAELEKNLLVKKLKSARKRVRDKGDKCEGRKSYEELAPTTIKTLKELRQSGMGYRKIAQKLNDDGLKTCSGKKWTTMNVLMMIRNH